MRSHLHTPHIWTEWLDEKEGLSLVHFSLLSRFLVYLHVYELSTPIRTEKIHINSLQYKIQEASSSSKGASCLVIKGQIFAPAQFHARRLSVTVNKC